MLLSSELIRRCRSKVLASAMSAKMILKDSVSVLDLRRVALGIAGWALTVVDPPPKPAGLSTSPSKIRGKVAD